MHVKLFFKDMDGDAVPYLWNDAMGDNEQASDSQQIVSRDAFEIARMSCSNRSRTITIVQGRVVAESIAYLAQHNEETMSIMTEIGDGVWAVGSLLLDGSYDDGIPLVTDSRFSGEPITFEVDEDMLADLQVTVLADEFAPNVVEISARPDVALDLA